MSDLVPIAAGLCIFLLTYLLHSTLFVCLTSAVTDRLGWVTHPELRVLIWKLALVLPIGSALAVTCFDLPHFGLQLPVSMLWAIDEQGAGDDARRSAPHAFDSAASPRSESELASVAARPVAYTRRAETRPAHAANGLSSGAIPVAALPKRSSVQSMIVLLPIAAWLVFAMGGLGRLFLQLWLLQRLRCSASRVTALPICDALHRLQEQFGIRRPVALLQTDRVQGPMTAGILRPYILLPVEFHWPDVAQRDALLAHELVHVARWDALWNLTIQLLGRIFPFQPLNGFAGRQLRREMDFVADSLAARTSEARIGLAHSLIALGEKIAGNTLPNTGSSNLAACGAAFDSLLGRRIEILLAEEGTQCPSNLTRRSTVVVCMLVGAAVVAAAVPRAIAHTPHISADVAPLPPSRIPLMNKPLSTVVLLAGLAVPIAADEPPAKPEQPAETKTPSPELKTTPDPLPQGIRGFNGMLVGRLAAKDIEKGTFLVRVDAVPRVWQNSNSGDPKSIVGKTVEVTGVFGRFLDVLVVTRTGETVEFECKHDGERLKFPGELLRKVAAYDPADYPELPEEFRGFQGSVTGTIVKKDPETFELIVKVERVTDTWKDNKAKEAKSIEGKPLMLAGFWNRKDAYHNLKVGDRIETGMKHIGLRSDHMTVAESVRKVSERSERETPEKTDKPQTEVRQNKEQRGFRGMLVGRLVTKDIERGTFTITVDAVPRVWKNNQAESPKSLLGTNVTAEGVTGKMLDVLVVVKTGETIEFGALHDGENRMRVGEVLRKVSPVKPGDYPVLPDEFRGFKGMVSAKVVRKDDQLMDMVVEITAIKTTFPASRAKEAESIIGKQVMLGGFWQRKEAFHGISVGDAIECGVDHPQTLSDHLNVIESVKKVDDK